MDIGSARLTKNQLRDLAKVNAEEMLEVIKGYVDMIEDDLKHAMTYITKFCDEEAMYELGAIIESARENVEFLSSEAYFVAYKLGKEMKKNGSIKK